ncbi:hypothetical protein DSECCO2_590350 [anaerobic digester metagenome]
MAVKRDKSQRGKHRGVLYNAPGFNARLFYRLHQQPAEGVGPYLTEESRLFSVGGQRGQIVDRCAAGLGRHGGVSVFVRTESSKINKQLANGRYIVHKAPSFLLCRRIFIAEQTIGLFVLLNGGEAPNRLIKAVIGMVVVALADLAQQHGAAA